jgi:HEAT repeat protein
VPPSPVARAAEVAAAGLDGSTPPATVDALVVAGLADADGRVRAAALATAVRRDRPGASELVGRAFADADPAVRRRAAELAPAATVGADVLVPVLDDPDPLVAETAAWALGEGTASGTVVAARVATASGHGDALVREAAVAALGALGDPGGLPAVLAACRDKPAVRRRAVLALAAFEGPEVEAALVTALDDHDRQVRQAARDLLGEQPS